MAIRVATSQPQALLAAIKRAIEQRHVETWTCDKDGDFTHTPSQWANKCWLRPHVGSGVLTFTTLPPRGAALSKEIYAVYHGRFIEMLLAHFDSQFSDAEATAVGTTQDVVRASASFSPLLRPRERNLVAQCSRVFPSTCDWGHLLGEMQPS